MQSTVAESGATTESSAKKSWHPKGLFVLSSTEMWERFNFYGMRALLTLFLSSALAFSDARATIVYGGYLGLCFLTPMLGGYISDRYLGNRYSIMLGGLILAIGQLFMFFSGSVFSTNLDLATTLMWVGLGVQILGNGFFKPNISSMVGQLYPKGDNRMDSAFTIFYMGINVGSTLGMAICPLLGDHVDANDHQIPGVFKWGFLAAGLAIIIGTVFFWFMKDKYVVGPDGKPVGTKPRFDKNKVHVAGEEADKAHFTPASVLGCLVLGIAVYLGLHFLMAGDDPIESWLYPFIYASGITLAVLILSDKSVTKVERDRILVIYAVSFFVIFFWACFEQAGSSLTFIAANQTDRHFLGWNMPASFVQNANSIFIIVLAIPFSLWWGWLQKMKAEPISPVKQAAGLGFLALGYFIIAQKVNGLGDGKLGVIWLIVMYLFHTVGELWVSPIGLSLVAKLAPKRFSSLLMGVFFLSNASGYALSGTLGALLPPKPQMYQDAAKANINLQGILDGTTALTASIKQQLHDLKIPDHYPSFAGFTIHNLYEFFMVFVILPGSAAILLFFLSFLLKRMMHGVR